MKRKNRLMGVIVLLMVVLVVAACGQKDKEPVASVAPTASTEPASSEAPATEAPATEEPAVSEKPVGEGPSQEVKDLFTKVMSESSNLESFSVKMETEQKMVIAGTETDSVTIIDMDIINKPEVSYHQKMNTSAAGMTQDIETYLTSAGYFAKDSSTGTWSKFPQEFADQLLAAGNNNVDPAQQLNQLADFADDIVIEEKGDVYILTLQAKGDKFAELIAASLGAEASAAGGITINDLKYVIEVEKKTSFPLTLDVTTDMVVGSGEGSTSVKSVVKTVYSKHNAIKSIDVPKEALEAEEISLN